MQRKISGKINYIALAGILLISSLTALAFNYLNPKGLTIIEISKDEIKPAEVNNGKIEFFKPIIIAAEDAHLLFTKGVQFVDVRLPEEYRRGHIPNSINIPYEYIREVETILENIPVETPLAVYGNETDKRICNAAAEEIFAAGYKKVYVYSDGFESWLNKGYETAE